MKTKRVIICALVLLMAFAMGFTGVLSFSEAESRNTESRDMLVGVFVTREYIDLFDFESYFNDNAGKLIGSGEITAEEAAVYSGRIYAEESPVTDAETGEIVEYTVKYSFPGLEGWLIGCMEVFPEDGNSYIRTIGGDDVISRSDLALNSTDGSEEMSIDAMLYVSAAAENMRLYFNPVYQDAQGSLYVVSGQGIRFYSGGGEGTSYAQTYSDSVTTVVDGAARTKSSSIKMTVATMYPPERIVLLSYGAGGELLERLEYEPDGLPEELVLAEDAVWLTAEIYKSGSDGESIVSREIYGKTDDGVTAFRCREDGMIERSFISLRWGE